MNLQEKIFKLLPEITRPYRYTGSEIGSVVKKDYSLNIALSYPDLYDIGMGNLALKILYQFINEQTDAWAQRVFSPWLDMEEMLRREKLPLYTLEGYNALFELDLLAFTIPYELVYTNILTILDLGGIPLLARERGEGVPLVIAGGPVTNNPEPMADFFDGFFIGEGEAGILSIINTMKAAKKQGLNRSQTLGELAKIPGFYSPLLLTVTYDESGYYIKEASGTVKRQVMPDLNGLAPVTRFPLPWGKVAHDKGMVELFRGCYHRCRFCLAGNYYKPVREVSPAQVQRAVREIFIHQGQREFTLLSLSSGDYSLLPQLLKVLNEEWQDNYVSFFLPSLKINSFNLELLEELNTVRKSGLTLAVEAGSEEIRRIINKDVSDEKLFEIIRAASKKGWKLVKLYFMLGFTDDLNKERVAIEDLLGRLLSLDRRMKYNVSINPLLPKAMTAFERNKLYEPEVMLGEFIKLKGVFQREKRVAIKYVTLEMGYLEGILARSNRKAGAMILEAYTKGCRFEGWFENFKWDVWKDLLEKHTPPVLWKALDPGKTLPWGFIDFGLEKDFLSREYEKSLLGEPSPSCDEGCKDFCGVCDPQTQIIKAPSVFEKPSIPRLFLQSDAYTATVSVIFTKTGPLRFVSQLDLSALWEKLLIKAQLPILFSEGFNPRPRLQFGFTAPVGVESEYENMRFLLGGNLSEAEVKERLSTVFSAGEIKRVIFSVPRLPSLQSITVYQDLQLEKVSIFDEKLLILIKSENLCLLEDSRQITFRAPITEKISKYSDYCDIYALKRIGLWTKEKSEVI